MFDKFIRHKEKRVIEIHQRMKNSKLHSTRKFKYWIVGLKEVE